MNRRAVLQGMAGFCVGCAAKGGDSSPVDLGASCTTPSSGDAAGYCLVEKLVVRVGGGALLVVGESILGNVDDNTAVLVGRDAAGFFARSAICTHACCIVALCEDEACTSPHPTPDTCGTVGPATGDRVLCPCHGSVFRISDGTALSGPAKKALPAYALALDGDDVLVDTGSEVGASERASA